MFLFCFHRLAILAFIIQSGLINNGRIAAASLIENGKNNIVSITSRKENQCEVVTLPFQVNSISRGGAINKNVFSKKHISKILSRHRWTSQLMQVIQNDFLNAPSTTEQLLRRSVVLHCLLATGLSSIKSEYLIPFLAGVHGIVFIMWFNTNLDDSILLQFMKKYFVLNSNFQERKTLTISMVGHGFSHAATEHLVSNMTALKTFGTLAISLIGNYGFAQLYSGGLLASTITTCLWPTISENFGVERENRSFQGASGAISAVITFVCLAYRHQLQTTIETPPWLLAFTRQRKLIIPLGLAGLVWFASDVLGLFEWNRYFSQSEAKKNIGFESHIGGSLFGIFYYLLYMLWERSPFLRKFASFPSKIISVVCSRIIIMYLFLLPNHVLHTELERRRTQRRRR